MSYRTNSLLVSKIELPSNEKKLSICLKPNGFSFSVISVQDVLLAIGEAESDSAFQDDFVGMSAQIRSYFQSIDLFPLGYCEVRLVVPSEYGVWVPAPLYDESHLRHYLNLSGYRNTESGLFASYNKCLDSYMVFPFDNSLVSAFKIALPKLVVTNNHDAFVSESLLRWSGTNPIMVLNLRDGYIDIEAFKDGNLLLSATYPVADDRSIVLQSVDVMKRLDLESPDMQLQLCGEVSKEKYTVLRNYFPSVRLYTGRPLRMGMVEMQQVHTYRSAVIL